MTVLDRSSKWTRSAIGWPQRDAGAHPAQRFFAFLSYSHKDEPAAEWLHQALEKFRVPKNLVGRLTEHGPVPRRLTPIFRDLSELAASDDLGTEIREAIAASRFLVVLCSPAAAQSRWTNAEVEAFKRARPEGCIFAAIVAGEPFASDLPGREQEECFPPALRFHYDRRGKRTGKRAEPLAADLRGDGDARRTGFLKLVAGMLGLGLDDLVQRDTLRRQRRLALLTAASLAGMVVTTGLAVTAIQARDAARDQRREAEGLIGFMLGDLREKLEPVGHLDALDGVGSRVLDYYRRQDMAELTDPALLQRARALSLMGEVAALRGDTAGALRLYAEARAGTAEAVRRDPDDPQRLFDHAQNMFWIGELARERGQLRAAEAAFLDYERLAARMVELEPDNLKWRMEAQYADANLGILLLAQRRFDEAARQFAEAVATIEALTTAVPDNMDYQKARAEVLAWHADAEAAAGRINRALAIRQRHVRLLRDLLNGSAGDVEFQQKLIPTHQALGNLHAAKGETEAAIREFDLAVGEGLALIPREPANRYWLSLTGNARLSYAETLLLAGQTAAAAAQTEAACRTFAAVRERDRGTAQWRAGNRDCLWMRAQLAARAGDFAAAAQLGRQALAASSAVNSSDPVNDRFAAARIRRLLGDIRQGAGDPNGAQAEWRNAMALLPATKKPVELAEQSALLQRLGMAAQHRQVAGQLQAIGYRRAI